VAPPALNLVDAANIGAQLAFARKARGMTQQQAADAIGVSRTTITAMEKGERLPKPAELIQLASHYGRQVSELVRPISVREPDSFIRQFRSARVPGGKIDDRAIGRDIDAFRRLCEDYLHLESIGNAPLARSYPDQYDTSGTNPEIAAEEVAASERNRLGIGDGPLGDIWGLLESDVGIRIFAPVFESANLAGLFAYTDELGACVAVNGSHPEERRRWTLAHEYAHFLSDRYRAEVTVLLEYQRVPESERFADAFARHFLMPSAGLIRRYHAIKRAKRHRITPADVMALSNQYDVPFQAMMFRLEELRLLSPGSWNRLKERRSAPDGTPAPIGMPDSQPSRSLAPARYELLAVKAYEGGELSEGELARYLRTDRVTARERAHALGTTEIFESGEWGRLSIDLSLALTD
jgi:Zn-dependent peptidase ImmA (M78 family)/transcriptional regulator with XRE-family HTH domain